MFTLLIVDDEPLFRQGMSQLVDFASLSIDKVYLASDGIHGLQLVKEHHPDMVLADINMPRMDGLLLAKHIKEIDPNIKIAMITGYDYFDYALAALKAKVDDFILKPVSKKDIEQLLLKMGQVIKDEKKQQGALSALQNIANLSKDSENNDDYKPLILQILKDNYSDTQFSLTKLAKKVNLSPGYLSSLFKELFTKTFSEYLLTLRLERAKILLLTTIYKNYEISEQLGFIDPNYFSTAFKKKYGMSPTHYRKMKEGMAK
ncbi:MAG: response regulator [Clostridiales bacterium]|nr:response regulator [Clostridiales bacterium]